MEPFSPKPPPANDPAKTFPHGQGGRMQAVHGLLLNGQETGLALCLHCLGLSHQPPSPWGLAAGPSAWGEGTILYLHGTAGQAAAITRDAIPYS